MSEQRVFKAEGLVIRSRPLGEADRLVTILTAQQGIVRAVARGARRTRSRLAAGVDLFTHGRYNFHRGRTWPIVTGQEVLRHFSFYLRQPELYICGLYLGELAENLVAENEPGEAACALLLDAWQVLDDGGDSSMLLRAFELQLTALSGYCPLLTNCTTCGAGDVGAFSPRRGGVVCSRCRRGGDLDCQAGTLALARQLLRTPLSGIAPLRAGTRQKQELDRAMAAFLAYHPGLGAVKSRRLLPSGDGSPLDKRRGRC